MIEIEKIKNHINKEKKEDMFIINKYNKNAIDDKIIKNIFENKNIIKIKYSIKYNNLINNFKIMKDDKFFEKEYKRIIKNIIEM